jgi:hypothetical protein
MQRIEGSNASLIGVVFVAAADLTSEIVTNLDLGREVESLFYIRPCQVRSRAGLKARYQRSRVLSMMGRIFQVQVSGE